MVKVDILVNGEKVDALSMIVHRDRARPRALQACERLKEAIPRHMFKIPIQGAVGRCWPGCCAAATVAESSSSPILVAGDG